MVKRDDVMANYECARALCGAWGWKDSMLIINLVRVSEKKGITRNARQPRKMVVRN